MDAFPALPPAAKPTSTIFGYGTGAVRRDVGGGSNSGGFAWGASPAGSGTHSEAQSEAQSESEQVRDAGASSGVGGKKKGNKGKKEVLVKWG